jgi:glycolate oxidase
VRGTPSISPPSRTRGGSGLDRLPEAAWAAAGEIFALTLRLGGTLTGEHGLGVLKRQWLAEELGPAAHGLQRRIKQAFDPQGILSPGKAQ